jgi:hypothetical protein
VQLIIYFAPNFNFITFTYVTIRYRANVITKIKFEVILILISGLYLFHVFEIGTTQFTAVSSDHTTPNSMKRRRSSPIIIITFNYALRPLRLIVRSGLDVPTFATRRPHACHHARRPSGGRWNCRRKMSGNFA